MTNNEANIKEQVLRIQNHIYGYMRTCVIHAFSELEIADIISSSPKTLECIASSTYTKQAALKRLLRCATSMDLICFDTSDKKYHLLPDGQLLKSDHPFSQCYFARLMGSSHRYQPWGYLTEILKDGNSEKYSVTYGKSSLSYLNDKKDELEVFNNALTNFSSWHDMVIAASYDFTQFKHMVDIGCGSGTFLKSVLEKNPTICGTMFDLKINDCKPDDAIINRLYSKQGSFFNIDDIPTNCDLYSAKNVIHNFNLSQKQEILKNISTAMSFSSDKSIDCAQKRLLIIEYLLEENNAVKKSSIAQWMDLHLFILNDGGELTLNEYKKMALNAGLVLTKVIPTPIGRHIMEFKLKF